MSSNIRLPKICQHCGNEFIAKTTVTKFCGDPCAKAAYKKRKREEKIRNATSPPQQQKQIVQQKIGEKDFLSIAQTCELLGASRMTIYRQIKKGKINAGKLGRRVVIKRTEIEKLFEQ